MRYSQNLLKRYLSLPHEVDHIAAELTVKTCEVEEIVNRVIPHDIVIGKVVSTRQHPNADKLTVCELDCGPKGTYQICTGGENVVADSYVPVALPGCYLPAINLKIEPREMRGEASNGMICSKQEIGIPEDLEQHWIWTLQYGSSIDLAHVPQHPDMDDITDKDLGTPLAEKYPWLQNRMLEVDNKTITHRPDLFGHFGMSVEMNAIFPGQSTFHTGKTTMQHLQQTNIFETLSNATPAKLPVNVTSDYVRTYALVEISGIQVRQSDLFLRTHLYDLGLQPRNNWVDFSNYVMYLTGQPIHIFDAKKVTGAITVRQATPGEKFVDLFDKEHILLESDIVIADNEKVLALAGVIGGANSGVDENTTDIFIEIGNFDPVAVRKTGTRLALRTDAELRFEKDINPLYTLHTVTMVVDELRYLSKSMGTYTLGGIYRRASSTAPTPVTYTIPLDTLRVEKLLFGTQPNEEFHISDQQIAQILTSLGCTISPERNVQLPVRRGPTDITQEIDLIEEIARIYGFATIPTKSYIDKNQFVPFSRTITWHRSLEDLCVKNHGFDQVETYPWIDKHWIDVAGVDTQGLYSMQNPLTPEQKYLRDTLVRSLLEILQKNAPYYDTLRIMEIGKVWNRNHTIIEQEYLGLALRQKQLSGWEDNGMLYLKGVLQTVWETLGVKGKRDYVPTAHPRAHPKQQAIITCNQQPVGTLQTIHPLIMQEAKLPTTGQVVIAQLSLSLIEQIAEQQKQSLSRPYETIQDQIVRRDINIVIDRGAPYGMVSQAVQKVKEIKEVEVFDVYAGERLDTDKKSIGLRLKIVGTGELQTAQINAIVQEAIKAIEAVGGTLRT